LNDATDEMKRLAERTKDQQADKTEGWTEDTRAMLDLYFETVSFIEHNYIMIDEFSNINTLTNYFAEGLFASYCCKSTLGGKLIHFTDPIIEKIVHYGKSDELRNYRRRYEIKVASYERNGPGAFIPQSCSLLKSYQHLVEYFADGAREGAESLWPRYRRMFSNALTMAGILELTREEIAAICEQLLPFLRIQKHIHPYELETSLSYFLRNNASLIATETLEDFLHFAFNREEDYRSQLLTIFYNISYKRRLTLHFTESEWEAMQAKYLVNETFLKNHAIVNDICSLYRYVSNSGQKKDVADFLVYQLGNHFKGEVYYWAVMNDLVKPTRPLTDKYEHEMIALAEKGRQPRIFEEVFYTDHRLDEFLNFCFRYKRLLSATLIQPLQKIDNYYRWLTNIDGFDYSQFNDDWLYVHMTFYYKQQFRASKALKSYLRKRVTTSNDHRIGQLFIDLYMPVQKRSWSAD